MSLIDKFAPEWQFREMHRIVVLAPAEAARRAIREVTAREIRLFRFLTWLRRAGKPGPESILNPPPDEPILKVALRTGFVQLANTDKELVLGTVVMSPSPQSRTPTPQTSDQFLAITGPGYAKAVMNFRVDPSQLAMCTVRTETRVWASDADSARKFARYWWTIRLGSGLIRRMWLRAIRRRAEKIGS